jgi:plastocyanin
MNFACAGILVMAMGTLLTAGCAPHKRFPESSLTGTVYELKIGESVTPPDLTAKRGDEVRWINMNNAPVDVALVQTQEELISCQKGFGSTNLGYVFGTSEYENIVMATVRPSEYAGLCFSIPGKYSYTIRTGPSSAGSTHKLTGSITIE